MKLIAKVVIVPSAAPTVSPCGMRAWPIARWEATAALGAAQAEGVLLDHLKRSGACVQFSVEHTKQIKRHVIAPARAGPGPAASVASSIASINCSAVEGELQRKRTEASNGLRSRKDGEHYSLQQLSHTFYE